MGTFADDVVVKPAGAGRYVAALDESWNIVRFPQGGVVAALGLRAAEHELDDPDVALRTCTTVFAGAVAHGDLEITVELLRRGRTAAQVRTEVRNAGADSGATTVAVYGTTRSGPTFTDVTPPTVAPPMECPSYRDPPPPGMQTWEPTPFWLRVEGRAAIGHPPWEEHEPISSDTASWYRFDDPPLREDGSLDPLAVVTLTDRMPNAIAERLGHQGPMWFAPSADLTVHLFEPLRTEWVLAHDRARWADDGWASVETMLWDEAGVPIAYATQMALFTYL
ncbi:MAG: acyl-CoA thioesterase [Mycobacteriales bacterium]